MTGLPNQLLHFFRRLLTSLHLAMCQPSSITLHRTSGHHRAMPTGVQAVSRAESQVLEVTMGTSAHLNLSGEVLHVPWVF